MLKILGVTVQKFSHAGDQGLGRVEQCRLQLLWKQLQDRTASSAIAKAIQNTYSWPSTFTSVSSRWEGVHDGRWTLSLTHLPSHCSVHATDTENSSTDTTPS